MSPEPLLDKSHIPSLEDVVAFIGQLAGQHWTSLYRFVVDTYQLQPEWKYEGAKSGWTLYFRKSGRALVNLMPDREGFTALVVLGAKEAENALAQAEGFGSNVRERLETALVYHDGRWLFIRVHDERDIEDIQKLLLIKKKPPRIKAS